MIVTKEEETISFVIVSGKRQRKKERYLVEIIWERFAARETFKEDKTISRKQNPKHDAHVEYFKVLADDVVC